jgi:hypothetical protein
MGHTVCKGETKKAYRILVGRIQQKRPFIRPMHRWEDTPKI